MLGTIDTGSSKSIRALDRGLLIVEILSKGGHMSLAELRKTSGLSNPTLLRILLTLQNRGWVRRNIVEGRYELAHTLDSVLGEAARAYPLAEIAASYLLDLKGRQAGWPSDLCMLVAHGRLEIVESTRLRGPMAPTRTALGIRPSMVFSAHGRAILAFSNAEQRKKHYDAICQIGTKDEVLWVESGRLETEIAKSRDRSFGLREADYWQPPFDHGPELGAIAVPVLSNTGVHGSISLLWMEDEMALDDVLSLGSLGDLQKASARIGVALDKSGVPAPEI